MLRNLAALALYGVLSFLGLPVAGQETVPLKKYGPKATRLYEAREHIRESPAPDYWALMPYYRAQPSDAGCSLAVATMLMNGLRVRENLSADEPLITPGNLLERLNDPRWAQAMGQGGEGVSLDELAEIVRKGVAAYGLKNVAVKTVHIEESSPLELDRLRKVLARNEQSDRNFLIANFLQSKFTGDPAGNVGHFAPVAAYDARRSRVLILDPDREWYEPYWVSDQTFLEGMATKDPDAKQSRGYLWVQAEESTRIPNSDDQ